MLLGFVLAVASGLIVNLITAYFRGRQKADSIFEITRRSQVIISKTTFEDGAIIQETTETRIEESTFRLPPPSISSDRRLPFLAGFLVFLVVIVILAIA